jgi:hypothetical protein
MRHSLFITLFSAVYILGSVIIVFSQSPDHGEVDTSYASAEETVLISPVPRQPFQASIDLDILPGEKADLGNLYIPAGKRLVIENVSAVASGPAGQDLIVSVGSGSKYADEANENEGFPDLDLVLASQGVSGDMESLAGDQRVLIFADESVITDLSILRGLGVSVELSRDVLSGSAAARVSFSGYLEDLPAIQ